MKVSFVIPFYGADITGGAETQCKRLVENLALRGVDVEVLTTTLRDLATHWNNQVHEPAVYDINGVTVRRFTPRITDTDVFVPINNKIVAGETLTFEEEIDYAENAINSDTLYQYIGDNQKERIYFFMPYLFGISLNGTRIAPWKSFIVPCLHDEGYANMELTRRMFDRVNGALFNSKAEMRLAMRKYDGMRYSEPILMGEGVDTISGADGARFREQHKLGDDPFILYVGRRDITKNTPQLIEYFQSYKNKYPASNLKLVLIGGGEVSIDDDIKDATLDLGFVTAEAKHDALAAATMLCQPSLNESFSLVIMESWRLGRPVLVHSKCEPTTDHITDSGGGFAYGDFPEFAEAVNLILDNPDMADEMGAKGKNYVEKNYSWDVICARFKNLLKACEGLKV